MFFFLGQAPTSNWEDTTPPQTSPLHSSQYLSPTFNLTPTPLHRVPSIYYHKRKIYSRNSFSDCEKKQPCVTSSTRNKI